MAASDASFAAACGRLRAYYELCERSEWWWVMDDSLETIGQQLQGQGHVVLDQFLLGHQAEALREEVLACRAEGRLQGGGLVNGQLEATEAKYADRRARGDEIGWFDPEEWHHGKGLEAYLAAGLENIY